MSTVPECFISSLKAISGFKMVITWPKVVESVIMFTNLSIAIWSCSHCSGHDSNTVLGVNPPRPEAWSKKDTPVEESGVRITLEKILKLFSLRYWSSYLSLAWHIHKLSSFTSPLITQPYIARPVPFQSYLSNVSVPWFATSPFSLTAPITR